MQRYVPGGVLLGLIAAAALGLWLVAPAGAQPPTCNGLPATIVGASPGPIDGTAGDDVIVGTAGDDQISGLGGADVICAGPGKDRVTGGQGADVALLEAGDDTFVWSPGDSSDVVEGGPGADALLFNGSNASEKIDLSANGARLRLFRDVASVTMDVDDTEQVIYNALGGADTVAVGSLAGTDALSVALNLAGVAGGATGDGQADSIVVSGTTGADTIAISGGAGSLAVAGLSATISVSAAEGALDSLQVNALDGGDTVAASPVQIRLFLPLVATRGGATSAAAAPAAGGLTAAAPLPAGVIRLTLSGGPGDDTLSGGLGDDQVIGGPGADRASLSDGGDTFTWNPGDGSDVVEGGAGADALIFNGSNASESIDLSASGARLRLSRDVASVTMDVDGVEQVSNNALGGADTIAVGDLSATAVQQVALSLASAGVGDGQADRVTLSGTGGADTVSVAGSAVSLTVTGLGADVSVGAAEAADSLTVNGAGGDDTVSAQTLPAGVVSLTIDGGPGGDALTGSQGADLLLGGDGADTLVGGRGSDVALLGAGDDSFTWSPGDGSDVVEGQADADTLLFNGANVSESIDLSANGARARFFRNVANITMDLDGVESIIYNALGGADIVTVGDLSGTLVRQVAINLAGAAGGTAGDGQADSVIISGTSGSDDVSVVGGAGLLAVTGLSASIGVGAAEAALDSLRIVTLGGADVVSAQALPAGVVSMTIDGGADNDTLTGSAGNDTFTGGPGADQFSGGPGADSVTDFSAAEGDTADSIP